MSRLLNVDDELRYVLRYMRGYRLAHDKPYRMRGTILHLILAYYYGELMRARGLTPPAWLFAQTLEERLAAECSGFAEIVERCLAFRRYYIRAAKNESFEPVAIERQLYIRLGDVPEIRTEVVKLGLEREVVTMRGDLTALVNGKLVGIDYKSTEEGHDTLPRWSDNIRLDYELGLQMPVTLRSLRMAYGEENVRGVAIRRLKASEPFHFDYQPLRIEPHVYEGSAWSMLGHVKRELEVRARVTAGGRPTPCWGHCMGRYGACDYINLCAAPKDQRRDVLASLYTTKKVS